MRVVNTGSSVWLNHSKSDIGVVNIGVHLLDEKNNMLSLGWKRIKLLRQLKPGEALTLDFSIDFPEHLSGHFRFVLIWFQSRFAGSNSWGMNQNALKYFVFKKEDFYRRKYCLNYSILVVLDES